MEKVKEILEASELTDKKIEKYIVRTSNFETMSRKEKQLFIANLIKKITVSKHGEIDIETTYSDVVGKLGGATPNTTLLVPWWVNALLRYNFIERE